MALSLAMVAIARVLDDHSPAMRDLTGRFLYRTL